MACARLGPNRAFHAEFQRTRESNAPVDSTSVQKTSMLSRVNTLGEKCPCYIKALNNLHVRNGPGRCPGMGKHVSGQDVEAQQLTVWK